MKGSLIRHCVLRSATAPFRTVGVHVLQRRFRQDLAFSFDLGFSGSVVGVAGLLGPLASVDECRSDCLLVDFTASDPPVQEFQSQHFFLS